MARIAGVNIPTNKRVIIALQYIHGIGPKFAAEIVQKVGIPAERRVNQLTDAEVLQIREAIDRDYQVEGDLRREQAEPDEVAEPVPADIFADDMPDEVHVAAPFVARRLCRAWAMKISLSDIGCAVMQAEAKRSRHACSFDVSLEHALRHCSPEVHTSVFVPLRIERDVLERFKTRGAGHWVTMNAVLRALWDASV